MPIPRHYSYGPRKLNIILTQLRCNASFLNYDLCKVKILSNASCNCGAPCANSHHFFFDCDKYTDNKEILFIIMLSVNFFCNISSVGKPRTDSVPPTMQSQIPKSRDVTLFFLDMTLYK